MEINSDFGITTKDDFISILGYKVPGYGKDGPNNEED